MTEFPYGWARIGSFLTDATKLLGEPVPFGTFTFIKGLLLTTEAGPVTTGPSVLIVVFFRSFRIGNFGSSLEGGFARTCFSVVGLSVAAFWWKSSSVINVAHLALS